MNKAFAFLNICFPKLSVVTSIPNAVVPTDSNLIGEKNSPRSVVRGYKGKKKMTTQE
jgi:hypothetical protein